MTKALQCQQIQLEMYRFSSFALQNPQLQSTNGAPLGFISVFDENWELLLTPLKVNVPHLWAGYPAGVPDRVKTHPEAAFQLGRSIGPVGPIFNSVL